MDIKEGVYAKSSVITIGTASTSKKTTSVNYYFAKPLNENTVLVDLLNIKNEPVGFTEEVPIEQFKKEYEFVADLKTFQKKHEQVSPEKIKAEEHVKRGDKHLQNKEYLSAEFEYGTALRYDKKNLKAHHGLSKVYLETGEIDKAKEYLHKIGELDDLFAKENKHIFNEVAINLRKQKMYDEAIKNYKKAIIVDPEDEVLYYNMARAYYEKGELENALKYFKKSVELNPDFNEGKKAIQFVEKKLNTRK